MKKIVAFATFLLLCSLANAQIIVNPSSLSISTEPNTNFRKYFNVTNIGNATTLYISKEGIIAEWCTVEPSVLTIGANSTSSFYCQFVIPNVTGSFSGALVLDGNTVPISLYIQMPAKEEEEEGFFDFLTTTYGVSVQQGYSFVKSFYLRNDMSVRVEVKDFNFIGSGYIMTPEGGKPVRIEAWELGYLEPGEEKTIDVRVDGSLPVGTYKATLEVYGLTPSAKKVTADLTFTITVVEQPSPIPQVELVCPSEAYEGELFTITLNNINKNTKIFHSIPLPGEVERTDTKWVYKTSGSVGHYNITILLLQDENFDTKSCEIDIVPKPVPKQIWIWYNITDGRMEIVAKDRYTNDVLPGATIKVDGKLYTGPIEVFPGITYTITATLEGYEPATQTVTVPLKIMTLSISPQAPEEGDEITIKAYSGSEEVNAEIMVDGEKYTGPVKLKAGKHIITAELEGYRKVTQTLIVKQRPSVFAPLGNILSYWWVVLLVLIAFFFVSAARRKPRRRFGYTTLEKAPKREVVEVIEK